jgi:tetratricopeptide (TPR) repeat protein
VEAAHKAKDLAASETIARGGYEQVISGSKESPILAQLESKIADKIEQGTKETESLQKRLEVDPTEPSLYLQLAAKYKKANEFERARAVLQQGLGPTGNNAALQMELYELELVPFRKQLDVVEAKLRLVKANASEDDDAPDEQELLKTKQKLVKEIQTREVEVARARADRHPQDQSLRLDLGMKLLKLDLIDQAIAELQQARRDDKLKGKACLNLGLCFRKRNNWRLAQRNFEEALQALAVNDDASRKETLFQLATGTAEAGDVAKAMDFGHELANLDFNYKGIGTMLDEWETRK